jgi:hypothetical protein
LPDRRPLGQIFFADQPDRQLHSGQIMARHVALDPVVTEREPGFDTE